MIRGSKNGLMIGMGSLLKVGGCRGLLGSPVLENAPDLCINLARAVTA